MSYLDRECETDFDTEMTTQGAQMAFDWLQFDCGRARFIGFVQGPDDAPHEGFAVEIDLGRVFFGEYRQKWAPNEIDFDIEIVSFGFSSANNIGNDSAAARERFPAAKRAKIKKLVRQLITDSVARTGVSTFSSSRARFTDKVLFAENWIRQ